MVTKAKDSHSRMQPSSYRISGQVCPKKRPANAGLLAREVVKGSENPQLNCASHGSNEVVLFPLGLFD